MAKKIRKEKAKEKSLPEKLKESKKTKRKPLIIKNCLNIKEGCIIKGKTNFKKKDHQPINLKITTSRNDWERLCSLVLSYPGDFQEQFLKNFIYPSFEKLHRGPRGHHKARGTTVFWIKTESCWLYEFFFYWSKKSETEWPEYLTKLIDMIRQDNKVRDIIINGDNKYRLKELTAYCIDKVYSERAKKLKLKPFFEFEDRESTENFYYTYIKGDKYTIAEAKSSIKGKKPQEVANFAYQLPLKLIFESLELI